MPDAAQKSVDGDIAKAGRVSGWYVFFLAWFAYAAAFFAFSKSLVKPAADIANSQLLEYGPKYGPFVGVALGLLSFLATGIVYLIVRLIRRKPSRAAALILTALGYAPWLAFGWDLAYREKRYAEVARAIITYLGKPMLSSAEVVCGAAVLGAVLTLVLKKRAK